MTPNRHSPIAHAAYHDLLASLKDEAVSALRGTPTKVVRNGKTDWYDSYRVGTDVRKTYIGENMLCGNASLSACIRTFLMQRRQSDRS